jgi:hypothetical protein
VPGALAAGQWVVDAFGAPSTLPSDLASLRSGDDPVLSAVTVFRQLDRIMGDARSVHRFDPESLSYRPKEDPFPHPDRDAGELRYDADRPPLPRPGAGGAASRVLPGPQHFRKLAIYVRRGRVVRILERVDISDRLRDLERIYNLGVTASDAASVRATQALAVINRLRKVTGGEAIRQHTLDVRFTDLGRPVSIELPADAVPGNLAALPHRGDHEAKRG